MKRPILTRSEAAFVIIFVTIDPAIRVQVIYLGKVLQRPTLDSEVGPDELDRVGGPLHGRQVGEAGEAVALDQPVLAGHAATPHDVATGLAWVAKLSLDDERK